MDVMDRDHTLEFLGQHVKTDMRRSARTPRVKARAPVDAAAGSPA